MSARRDTRAARALFRAFREVRPNRTRTVGIDLPRAAAVVGPVEFIGYTTTHGGKTYLYIHEFAEGSRPLLAAGRRRSQLFLVGGRFTFTARGITDLDPSGRPIDAPSRYIVKPRRQGRR